MEPKQWLMLIPVAIFGVVASLVAMVFFLPAVAVSALFGRTKWLDELFVD